MSAGYASNNSNSYSDGVRLSRSHGCEIRLSEGLSGRINHEQGSALSFPIIRSYSDGIKVGCTFVTTETLKKLYEWHTDFLGKREPKTHRE